MLLIMKKMRLTRSLQNLMGVPADMEMRGGFGRTEMVLPLQYVWFPIRYARDAARGAFGVFSSTSAMGLHEQVQVDSMFSKRTLRAWIKRAGVAMTTTTGEVGQGGGGTKSSRWLWVQSKLAVQQKRSRLSAAVWSMPPNVTFSAVRQRHTIRGRWSM